MSCNYPNKIKYGCVNGATNCYEKWLRNILVDKAGFPGNLRE